MQKNHKYCVKWCLGNALYCDWCDSRACEKGNYFIRRLYRNDNLIECFQCKGKTLEDNQIINNLWRGGNQKYRQITLWDTIDGYLMRRLAELPKMPMVAKLIALQIKNS